MNYRENTAPRIGAKYRGLERVFEITGLPVVEDNQWVEYYNINTKQIYSCRLEAFLERFTPTPE